MVKRLSSNELGVGIGNFNILTTFAVRYALGRDTLAASTIKRIISDSLDGLHEQTKYGIIRDIEDYIEQNESVPDLSTWEGIVQELKHDLERKKRKNE